MMKLFLFIGLFLFQNVRSKKDAETIFAEDFMMTFVNQTSHYHNLGETLKKLDDMIDKQRIDFSSDCDGYQTHYDLKYFEHLVSQRRRYKDIPINPKPKLMFISRRPIFEFSLNLTSKMGFVATSKFTCRISKKKKSMLIDRIVVTGACLDSPKIEESLIYDTWEPKMNPGNESVNEFLEAMEGSLPFDESNELLDEENFEGIIDMNLESKYDKNEFSQYMRQFANNYLLRHDVKNIKSDPENTAGINVITQQSDHLVLKVSKFFEYKSRSSTFLDMFTFFIEAKCNSTWKITRITMAPPSYFLTFGTFEKRTADALAHKTFEELENKVKEVKAEVLNSTSLCGNVGFQYNSMNKELLIGLISKNIKKSGKPYKSNMVVPVYGYFIHIQVKYTLFDESENTDKDMVISFTAQYVARNNTYQMQFFSVLCPGL